MKTMGYKITTVALFMGIASAALASAYPLSCHKAQEIKTRVNDYVCSSHIIIPAHTTKILRYSAYNRNYLNHVCQYTSTKEERKDCQSMSAADSYHIAAIGLANIMGESVNASSLECEMANEDRGQLLFILKPFLAHC